MMHIPPYKWGTIKKISRLYSKILGVFVLSFSSGIPFILNLGTLQVRLKDCGLCNTTIGIFALTTLPYALKFLWAPFCDRLILPYLSHKIGHRRSWILVSQILLFLSIIGLGMADPDINIYHTAMMSLCVALCAASYDNNIEAYRMETLSHQYAGLGASVTVIGFRAGMWIASGGALYMSTYMPWAYIYYLMAIFLAMGSVVTVYWLPSNTHAPSPFHWSAQTYWHALKTSVRKLSKKINYLPLLLLIVFFKWGDTVLHMMSMSFLMDLGFCAKEIAYVVKSFGLCAMIIGGIIGGTLLMRYSLLYNMLLSSVLLTISSALFIVQSILGKNTVMLFFTIGIENIACGISAATMITFLSLLCAKEHKVTHFALLTSISAIARVGLSIFAGYMADQVTWPTFFTYVTIGCIPAIALTWRYRYLLLRIKS